MNRMLFLWRLAWFSPLHFLVSGLLVVTNGYLLPLLPGLVVRQLFDALTGQAPVGWNIETLFAILFVVLLIHPLLSAGGNVAEPSLWAVAGALLRHNMLRRILHRPHVGRRRQQHLLRPGR